MKYCFVTAILLQYLICTVLFLNSTIMTSAIKYKSIEASNGTRYLVIENVRIVYTLPDKETYTEFFSDIPSNKHYDIDRSEPPVYKDLEIAEFLEEGKYNLLGPAHSLRMSSYDPDHLIEQVWNKVMTLSPVKIEERLSKNGYQNPCFTRWLNRTIGIWPENNMNGKTSLSQKYKFLIDRRLRIDWLGDENIFFFDNMTTSITTDNFPSYSYTEPKFGIGGPQPFYYDKGVTGYTYKDSKLVSFNTTRYLQDARLVVVGDDRLVISYALAAKDLGNEIKLHQVSAKVINGTIRFSKPSRVEMISEKNWCPFVSEGRLYYIRSFNPMHIVEILESNSYEMTDSLDPNLDEVFKVPVPKTIFKQANKVNLPWNPYYGDFIRGGTQAVFVRGVYLGFFHSKQAVQPGFKVDTYFMGAFTLCPTAPFSIKSMSPLPILKDYWYQGTWLFPNIDYVVYPSGIIVDEDQQHVWVLMGYQNAYMKLLRFNIDDLFRSMETASDCSETGTDSSGSGNGRRSLRKRQERH